MTDHRVPGKGRNGEDASGDLFGDPSDACREISVEGKAMENQQVECLGMTFESDEARRAYFLERLREKLRDPEFRKVEGFPVGEDDAILALSDPPYFTACPNPFLEDFVRHYGKPYDPSLLYHRSPFAVDVSEGKTDPIYTAHSYHTKVPPKAIMRAILHYTEPSDLVLDGFAGSGMTGVAARLCGAPEPAFRQQVESEWAANGTRPQWGARRAVLCDLAPAATFIAANYNMPFDIREFERAAKRILDEVEAELGWMYETLHTDGKTKGWINYTVWSEVFVCPNCTGEVVFVEEALDEETKRVREVFHCPHCKAELTKRRSETFYESKIDPVTGQARKVPKRQPVLINYSVGGKTYEKKPSDDDQALLRQIEMQPWPSAIPSERMMHAPDNIECWGDKWRAGTAAFLHVHHLFLPRAAHALAALWRKASAHPDRRVRNMLLFFVEQAIWGMSVLNRYGPLHFSQVNRYLNGVYYVASQISECSPWYVLGGKLKRLVKTFQGQAAGQGHGCITTTSSAASLGLPDNCIDYVFTDPPFGDSLAYAELNFFTEAFYQVFTNQRPEAIVSRYQQKGLPEYQELMRRCLAEFHRVLKSGRWLTMVFHNSSNAVWNAIQEALLSAGFVVADVRTLDKKQSSFNQVVSGGAVKQDLVISAYKPNGGLEERFRLHAGTVDGAWDFVRQHLKHLPVFVEVKGRAETIAERQAFLLFDRMVAFHIQRGATVPMGAAEFNAGLKQKFPERDGMYFLPDQVVEYDRRRLQVQEVAQLEMFVTDERSTIQWLRQQLEREPQTYQEIQPKFLRELHKSRHEQLPELREILGQNFLEDEQGRWYVPDPNRQIDLERLREKELLREFEEYKVQKQKRLKVFRAEAIRAGFKAAWAARDYQTIVSVAQRLPEDVLQEDQTLLMYYDNALTRVSQ